MADRIQQRRDTAARWSEYNPILLEGEVGYVTDNPNQYKIGDGVHAWNELPLRGFDGTLVHELGNSQTAAMSQKGVADELDAVRNFSINDFTVNGYINTDGGITGTNVWRSTDFIPVNSGTKYKLGSYYGAGAYSIAFYDNVKTFISGITKTENDYYEELGVVPDNARYIRCCSMNSAQIMRRIYITLHYEFEDIFSLENEVSEMLVQDIPFINGGYIGNNGFINSTTVWYYTDFIYVKPGMKFLFYGQLGTSFCGISFYDEKGSFISGISRDQLVIEKYVGIVPDGVTFLRACKQYIYFSLKVPTIERPSNQLMIKMSDNTIDGYIDIYGELQDSNSFKVTDYIELSENVKVLGTIKCSSSALYIAFYDENKNFISGQAGNANISHYSFEVEAPIGAKYVRATCENVTYLGDLFILIKRDVANIILGLTTRTFAFVNEGYIGSGRLGEAGKVVPTALWENTDFIPVSDETKYYIKVLGGLNSYSIAFYDENYDVISGIEVQEQSGILEKYGEVPSGTKYLRACNYKDFKNPIIKVSFHYDNSKNEEVQRYRNNLFKPFQLTGKKAVFFGDSITYGVASAPTWGHTQNNYVKKLSELCQFSSYDNLAISGSTFTYRDGQSVQTITNTILSGISEGSDYDVIFIAGGTNDYGGSYSIGSPADTDNTTLYGALYQICEHLKQTKKENSIVIFLTPINRCDIVNNGVSLIKYSNAIFEMAVMYGFNVICGYDIGFPESAENTVYRDAVIKDNVHPTELGFEMMAHNIYSILI